MGINVKISKAVYNSFQHIPEEEEVTVEIISKFGVAKDNILVRAFFFEVNINAIDARNGDTTRTFLIEAKFHYELGETKSFEITQEDEKYYGKCLELLNEKIINLTSQDNENPFDIENVIKEHNNSLLLE